MGEKIRVIVCGACGRVGQEVVKGVLQAANLELAGAVDVNKPKICRRPEKSVPAGPRPCLI